MGQRKKIQLHTSEGKFNRWLDSRKIVCRENYVLPSVITPPDTTDSIPKSLYEAEKDDMNNGEHELIDAVVGLSNVKWWHRIIERKGFRLNGFINHYPDFMVMTNSGILVLIDVNTRATTVTTAIVSASSKWAVVGKARSEITIATLWCSRTAILVSTVRIHWIGLLRL